MKKLFLLTLLICCFFTQILYAQQPSKPIQLSKGNFFTGDNVSLKTFKKQDLATAIFNNQYYVVVQFKNLPTEALKNQMAQLGILLHNYLSANAYYATINTIDINVLNQFEITSINPIPSFYKIDKQVENYSINNSKLNKKYFAINYFGAVPKEIIKTNLQKIGAKIIITEFDNNETIFIEPNKNIIELIAAMPFVNYISLQNLFAQTLNYEDKGFHAISGIQSYNGKNLQGKNVTVGVGDDADVTTHIDFSNRVINRSPAATNTYHGVHTSGTTAGAGIKNPQHMGIAKNAIVINQFFTGIITQAPVYFTDYKMVATNNSYYTSDNFCPGDGAYDFTSNYIDEQMKQYSEILHVFAAGNDGGQNCAPYPSGYATIKSGFQCAKNVLTVGGNNPINYLISNGSSRGPVNDGRLKPEIVANGVQKISATPFNGYGTLGGTSMAAPVVTGVSALLVERFRQINSGANPPAALLKAIMCNTAEDLGNVGPDYTYGFGLLNARKSIEAIESNKYFLGNTNSNFIINVPSSAAKLKVMLYWADAPANISSANALVNDLDLKVIDPATIAHLPLVLNAAPTAINALATEGPDHLNNIEQVVINNPSAGSYTLNVNLFNIPQGPQNFIVTYQIDVNGVTVEYPFGEETLVPGEIETIRWTAAGDDANTFAVNYSEDNGNNWIVINNAVPSSERSLNWTVPNNITNQGLIRVTKNVTGFTDKSDFNFSVLGSPIVTTTVPCEGFVQLNWNAINGATSYDVMQLIGDSMKVIANTAATTFLVDSLKSNKTYWLCVRAKNAIVSGRRSIGIEVLPTLNGGPCNLSPTFDNNFKTVSIDAPVTGRQFTNSALKNNEPVKITIKNLDDVNSIGVYNVFYRIDNGTIITESTSVPIYANGTYQYTFSTLANLSNTGIYNIKAWVKKVGDIQTADDTATLVIKNLSNPIIVLPVAENFETTSNNIYNQTTLGFDGDDKLDFKTTSNRGRARTFVNTGFALNGNRAITLDQSTTGTAATDSLLVTFNATNYNTNNQLRLDFSYKNHGQQELPDNKVWIRGNENNPWILAYDLYINQAPVGNWKKAIINVNDVLDTVLPAQAITSSFQIKFAQQGNTSANTANQLVDIDDGYTFDDINMSEALNDLALVSVISPSPSGCGTVGAQSVQVKIKNYSITNFTNIPIKYRVNGGAIVTETVNAIAAKNTITYTFTTPINFINNTEYNIDFWLEAPSDNYKANDSLIAFNIHSSNVISNFPYLEGFENNDGGFYTKGVNNSWQLGTPTKATISKAANGNKAWVTNLSANYNNAETSYLYSPCFNISSLTNPILSFSHIFKTEIGYDYHWVEYAINDGNNWQKLGLIGQGTNWYNDVKNYWNNPNSKWHVASFDLPITSGNIRFRIAFASDEGTTDDGVGIDDIHIFNKKNIYTGINNTSAPIAISGNNWIDLTAANGEKIASIQPQGNNLGATKADVFINTTPVRFTTAPNNQYYLDRNIVITPTTQPTTNVLVRFYFTDAEANNLINAAACTACSSIKDAYAVGVTKYTGSVTEENGDLTDNLTGTRQFILPSNVEIIPYDKGYYAEFSVNSFSEFWINNGGINANEPLPLRLISFEAIKENKNVKLNWQTTNEINSSSFLVERSVDGIVFNNIGTVVATSLPGINNYSFVDVLPLPTSNFYRLKLIDANGKFAYSPIRKINFNNNSADINIYPNPVNNGVSYIVTKDSCTKAILYDATGKLIKTFALQGTDNILNVKNIAKGVYQLKIYTTKNIQTKKIIIE
jgi:Subtilase family/Secretion system C-terminal sorting domain